MNTQLLPASEASCAYAAELLRAGEVVGIPTETVYGLAADALNPQAVRKIFVAKGRPQDNPLIVHIADLSALARLTDCPPALSYRLAEAFWPGPMTMILPKSKLVPTEVTAGLDTVGIRMPSHPAAREIIRQSNPLAAPSANRSGLPSTTEAAHVFADMDGRIPLIIDGGRCTVGVESTVIAVHEDFVRLLRPGGISAEQLQQITRVEIDPGVLHPIAPDQKVESPGMKYKHYSPKANVIILDGSLPEFCSYLRSHPGEGVYAMVFSGEETLVPVPCLSFGRQDDPSEQAYRLFDDLRKADELGAKTVYVRAPEQSGVGLAVYNRLLRSAGFTVIPLKGGRS